jgi:hypothetical protein
VGPEALFPCCRPTLSTVHIFGVDNLNKLVEKRKPFYYMWLGARARPPQTLYPQSLVWNIRNLNIRGSLGK